MLSVRMPGGLIEERLRAWVTRLLAQARHGEKTRLGRRLQKGKQWVDKYLNKKIDADLDTSVAIMKDYGITFAELLGNDLPTLTADEVEFRTLWLPMNSEVRAEL